MTVRTPLRYPMARKADVVEHLHGVEVADPYRWLEDLDTDDTRAFIAAQNEVTSSYLEGLAGRRHFKDRITTLWDHEKFGVPHQRGGRYFYLHNSGLQDQSALWVLEGLHGEPRLLLDPNEWSEDGTLALVGYSASDDGRLLAYGVAEAGSDWQQWKVLDVDARRDLDDELRWIKFTGAPWLADRSGFFYTRFPQPEGDELASVNQNQSVWFHRLHTAQDQDELVYVRPDHPDWYFGCDVTDDGRYLLITASKGTEQKNAVFSKDLEAGGSVVDLLTDLDAAYEPIGNDGPRFLFATDRDAPRSRIIEIDIADPAPGNWREVVPEGEHALETATVVGDRVFAVYLEHARSRVRVFDLEGTPAGEVSLPGIGSVMGFGGRRSDRETFFMFTSFTTPGTIYRYDLDERTAEVFREPRLDFLPADFETEQIFCASNDGTRVPIFVSSKKGLPRTGATPAILYGYGGYRISLTPSFSVGALAWMEAGGIWAVACTRGGGEYGSDWHLAGCRHKRQNVFDDFIAAGEHLIEQRYTSTEHLAIMGGSNGGLLVGACITQRPELFGAAHIAVGVLDMLRFHKFTVGWGWISDYGSPDDPDDFRVVHSYSPLHNLVPGTAYPATIITTGDHDDRVWPGHSLKFAATIQEAQGGVAPVLLRVETRGGHGLGKPTWMTIEELADVRAFLADRLGLEIPLAVSDSAP